MAIWRADLQPHLATGSNKNLLLEVSFAPRDGSLRLRQLLHKHWASNSACSESDPHGSRANCVTTHLRFKGCLGHSYRQRANRRVTSEFRQTTSSSMLTAPLATRCLPVGFVWHSSVAECRLPVCPTFETASLRILLSPNQQDSFGPTPIRLQKCGASSPPLLR